MAPADLSRYPRNQEQITAIEDALTLFTTGKLDTRLTASYPMVETIYHAEMRPLIRAKGKMVNASYMKSPSPGIPEQKSPWKSLSEITMPQLHRQNPAF